MTGACHVPQALVGIMRLGATFYRPRKPCTQEDCGGRWDKQVAPIYNYIAAAQLLMMA